MRVPNAERAIISPEKLRDYILSPTHPVGRFKAAFFRELGYSVEDWQRLELHLREHLLSLETTRVEETRYGRKFIVAGLLTSPTGKMVQTVSVWVIVRGEESPRFVTAYPGG